MSNKERSDSYSHILKYTGLFGGVQALSIGVALVRNKLVALILGPGGMGLVSLFNSTVKLVGDTTSFGIGLSAVRKISEAYDSGDEQSIIHSVSIVRDWCFLLALLGTFLCIVLSPFLSWFTFSWNGHTLHFICLSPIVGLSILTLGETAIIKSVRQLKHLAVISFYNIIAALVISVPIYYFFHMKGIVPSLLLMALAQFLLTIHVSYRLYPLHLNFSRTLFHEGKGMIQLGLAFVVAGVFTSGTDFFVRSYINNVSDIDMVGLYNAGVMMTITYVGMVFSAMDTDYFPRLSGINNLGVTFNTTVNRQIEMMLLLVSPMLVAFTIFLPILLPLLYSGKFTPVLGMMQIVVLAMYFRAMETPIEYITLAKGDSLSYMLIQAVYGTFFVAFVILGFHFYGLTGAGIGITLNAVLYFVFLLLLVKHKYGYHLSYSVIRYACQLIPMGLLAYAITFVKNNILYWSLGILLLIICTLVCLRIIRTKTDLWNQFSARLKGRFHRKEN